jgi:hypothetical protein
MAQRIIKSDYKEFDQVFSFGGVTFRPVGLGEHIVDHVESAGFQHREGCVELAIFTQPGIGISNSWKNKKV